MKRVAGCFEEGVSTVRNAEQRRRPSGAAWGWFGEYRVQPHVGREGAAMARARHKSDARAQRFASERHASGRFRAQVLASSHSCAAQRLFFGDFLLAPQKKVTPPPGGTPGNRTCHQPEAVSE